MDIVIYSDYVGQKKQREELILEDLDVVLSNCTAITNLYIERTGDDYVKRMLMYFIFICFYFKKLTKHQALSIRHANAVRLVLMLLNSTMTDMLYGGKFYLRT